MNVNELMEQKAVTKYKAALVFGSDAPKAKALQEAIPAEIILIGGAVSGKCSRTITEKG